MKQPNHGRPRWIAEALKRHHWTVGHPYLGAELPKLLTQAISNQVDRGTWSPRSGRPTQGPAEVGGNGAVLSC